MLRNVFLTLVFALSQMLYAQDNLVLNPSFEEVNGTLKCYLYGNEKFPIAHWSSASEGSVDVFSTSLVSTCIMHPLNDSFAGKKPHSGNNYLGFSNLYNGTEDYREYVRGNLSKPLEVGALYKIEFFVCLANFATATTNNIGLAFINNKMRVFPNVDPIPIKPDVNYSGKPIPDNGKWTLLSFDFVATEPNLDAFVIGNFFSSKETNFEILSDRLPIESYILIDDVSIKKIDVSFDIPTQICFGQTLVFPEKTKSGIIGKWSPVFNPNKSQTYTFTSEFDNSKFELKYDVEVLKTIVFELISYCENYEFYIEALMDQALKDEILSYNWKLNKKTVSKSNSRLKVSDFINELQVLNYVELEITTLKGCESIQMLSFSDKTSCKIQNEVSPNSDNENDFFDLESFGGVELKIYNRFGKIVYEKNDYLLEWSGMSTEGQLLPAANYYYQIITNRGEELSGWVQLVY